MDSLLSCLESGIINYKAVGLIPYLGKWGGEMWFSFKLALITNISKVRMMLWSLFWGSRRLFCFKSGPSQHQAFPLCLSSHFSNNTGRGELRLQSIEVSTPPLASSTKLLPSSLPVVSLAKWSASPPWGHTF